MGYYKTYNDSTEYSESISMIDFSEKELTDFLLTTGLIPEVGLSYAGSMEKLVFTLGADDEIYSNSEISFIEEVSNVYVFQEYYMPLSSGVMPCRVIAVQTNSTRDDNVYFCIAFEKIINKALDGYNMFLFMAEDGIIFGCKLFNRDDTFDCALSQIICDEYALEQIQYEFSFLQESKDFAGLYSLFVSSISSDDDNADLEETIIKRRGMQLSYLETLNSLEKELGIDTSGELSRYRNFFTPHNEESYTMIIEDVEENLSFIKSNRVNTYELLFEADQMERIAIETEKKNEEILSQTEGENIERDDLSLPSECMDDAEAMIKFLKKQKGL